MWERYKEEFYNISVTYFFFNMGGINHDKMKKEKGKRKKEKVKKVKMR